MSKRQWWAAAALTLAAVWGGVVGARAAEEAPVFRFSPPNGLTRTETVRIKQVRDFGQGRANSDTVEIQARYAYAAAAEGHTVTETMVAGRVLSGESAQAEIMLATLKGLPLTYRVSPSGQMQSVSGLERVPQELKKRLPAEAYEAMAPSLTPEKLSAASRTQWQADVTDLVGRPARVGTTWVSLEECAWPDGNTIKYYAARKVAGQALVQGKPCLRIISTYSTDPAEFKSFLGESGAALLTGLKPLPGKAKVTGEAQRVVDPATLMWYDGKGRLWVQAPIGGGDSTLFTFTREREYQVAVTPPKP